jgi:cytidylate kinase
MPVIALTTPLFTDTQGLLKDLKSLMDLRAYDDDHVIEKTARDHQISLDLLTRVVQVSPIAYNNFTHEREKAMAALEKTLADLAAQDNCIFPGTICHLIPGWVTHVLRVLAVSARASRLGHAIRLKGYSQQIAGQKLEQADQRADQWVRTLKNASIWDASLYDLVLDMEDQTANAAALIQAAVSAPPCAGREPRAQQVADLSISAAVQLALARLGGGLKVRAQSGHVLVTIERKRMNLPQTQSEILTSAKQVPGVVSVKTRIGANYYKSQMIKAYDLPGSTGRA